MSDDDSLPDTESASVTRLLKEIIRGATISISSHGFNGLGRLGLAYVITVFISPAAYGTISVMLQVMRFFRTIMSGTFTAISRTIPRYPVGEQNYLISIFFTFMGLFTGVVGILVHLLRDEIIARTLFTPDQAPLISLFGVTFVFLMALASIDSVLRAERRVLISNVIDRAGRPVAQFVVLSIAIFGFGVVTLYGLWTAITIAIVAMFLLSLFALIKFSEYDPRTITKSEDVLRDYASYASRTVVGRVFISLQAFSYSIFVAFFLTPVQAGIFGVAFALAGLIRWPLSSVNHIFPPIASGLYDAGRIDAINKLYSDTTQLIMVVGGALCTAAIIYAPTILGIFSQTYIEGALAFRFIAFGNFVAASFGTVGLLLLMTDNEDASLRLQILLASISIPTLWFSTSTYSLVGLAGAFMFLLTLNNVTELILLNYKEGLQPFHRAHVVILGAYVAVGGGLLLLQPVFSQLPHILLGAVSLLVTMGLLTRYVVTDRVYELICSYAPTWR